MVQCPLETVESETLKISLNCYIKIYVFILINFENLVIHSFYSRNVFIFIMKISELIIFL
jgi:hypothetical protein